MEFLYTAGQNIMAGDHPILLRGFGLGGWLLPEGYMWKLGALCDRPRRMETLIEKLCGPEYAAAFWRRYMDSYITREDFAWIASEGFNSVRLPLNARHLKDQDGWRRMDDCVAWCKEYGLYIILDMHGAPGGQTGQNIDDSEKDQPELFQDRAYQEELIALWRQIAMRYRNEKTIAGYDLLNEPLPDFFSRYNNLVLPLYREVTRAIREVDSRHMIIVEGLHWATDFSIFDPLSASPLDNNCMLQFHRYWSAPDRAGILPFLDYRSKLNVPLYMGEGGENNLDWYKAAFSLYERENISWSFWSYKKMDCRNSPISFPVPDSWPRLIRYLEGGSKPSPAESQQIFSEFLNAVAQGKRRPEVIRALKREAPINFPAEHFDTGHSNLDRIPGALYRAGEPLSILFHNGKTGMPNYQRMGGEPQPEEERMYVMLRPGEKAVYRYNEISKSDRPLRIRLRLRGKGVLKIQSKSKGREESFVLNDWESIYLLMADGREQGENVLEIICTAGVLSLDEIEICD